MPQKKEKENHRHLADSMVFQNRKIMNLKSSRMDCPSLLEVHSFPVIYIHPLSLVIASNCLSTFPPTTKVSPHTERAANLGRKPGAAQNILFQDTQFRPSIDCHLSESRYIRNIHLSESRYTAKPKTKWGKKNLHYHQSLNPLHHQQHGEDVNFPHHHHQ